MNECSKFPIGSRTRQICEGESELPLEKVNRFRAKHGLEPLEPVDSPAEPPMTVVKESRAVTTRVKANPVVATRKACGSCGKKSTQPIHRPAFPALAKTKAMPAASSPRHRMTLVERAKKYAESVARHLADDNSSAMIEDVIFRQSQCSVCPFNTNDECGLCGCPLKKNLLNKGKIAWRSESCPAGRWFRHNETRRPLVNPTRNLLFHIYPKTGAEWNWKWHIEQIRKNVDIFNGKICIGVVTGAETASAGTVQRLFDGIPVAEWVMAKNNKLAETLTFTELLRCVQTDDPNSVTMRGHTKGVTHHANGVEQRWKELMWQTCADWKSVNDALSSHLMAGPLKCHEPLVSKQPYRWFFAGSFWWQRDREVFQRDWQATEDSRWFSEYFPGLICKNEESVCLLHDFTDGSVLRETYWHAAVEPEWAEWRKARNIT